MVIHLMRLPLLAALAVSAQAQESLTLAAAIRGAWAHQSGLQAGEAMVAQAREQARAATSEMYPTVTAGAGWTRTDEPMAAFGMRLDQARIAGSDFNPDRLNHPEAVTGFGLDLRVSQPLYVGGRISAGRAASEAMARSEGLDQERRRQQTALGITEAYFGVQAAHAGVAFAEDALTQAKETERFVQARVDQGLLLKSEGLRIRAFRAQAEAALAEARRREASARSALGLLTGGPVPEVLATPLDGDAAPGSATGIRPDLQAARERAEAARQGTRAARGNLLPEVGLTLAWGSARQDLGTAGGTWTTASVGARWTFSLGATHRTQAAQAAARAAELNVRWSEAVADRERSEAAQEETAAQAGLKAGREAVEAAEAVRALRAARHREGLLPLTEVLDAETGLAGARALLLQSQLNLRLARARMAFAQGQPIEGVE